jgi:hypothetical protein
VPRSLDRYDYFWKSGNYLLHKFKEGGEITDHCLIYDRIEDGYVPIEDMSDHTLGDDIIRRMAAEGVPVIRELPQGAGFLERARMQLLEAGVRYGNFNRAFGALVEMKKRRCSNEAIQQRLLELIKEHSSDK